MGTIAAPFSFRPYFGGFGMGQAAPIHTHHDDQDPHLRSVAEVDGYHVHAIDGIGLVQDLLDADDGWAFGI